ncbi:26S proteasome regulatory subunit rpn-8 [Saitoella complicata NRRL Y-17804]|nr:26S proteasome regulatory subunit rpn-8 [Saitoella complicata NRRL Y-17804]ODQ53275.1 26S proteasome regulatory subunit rpn-8 [Saitoella complicata NRRL Y-17804]
MPAATSTETIALSEKRVVVHPLVLLSAVDHYNRSAKGTKKRVVGVLLGQNNESVVNVANSFAVPFEEDEKDPSVWFLDHNYVESMNDMFKKINAREKLIGWYHSGPRLRASDIQINEVFKKYTPNPVLVVIDVQPKVGLPTESYFSVDEIRDDGSSTSRTFVHVPSSVEAEEAEEIGVEHLLRDIKDNAVGTLATRITQQLHSLQGLQSRLEEIATYLQKVVNGELPVNHPILGSLQDIFNLLPNLSSPATALGVAEPGQNDSCASQHSELSRSLLVKTNDQLMCVYISSLIRAVLALHDLIDNKIQNRQLNGEDIDGEVEKKLDEGLKDAGEKKADDADEAVKEGPPKGGLI